MIFCLERGKENTGTAFYFIIGSNGGLFFGWHDLVNGNSAKRGEMMRIGFTEGSGLKIFVAISRLPMQLNVISTGIRKRCIRSFFKDVRCVQWVGSL